jgi:hypothetical protein
MERRMNDLKFTTTGDYMNTNKRIQELALQSANEIADLFNPGFFDDRMVTDVADINKRFAEMIIQECAIVIEKNVYEGIGRNASRKVKQHFGIGVEE